MLPFFYSPVDTGVRRRRRNSPNTTLSTDSATSNNPTTNNPTDDTYTGDTTTEYPSTDDTDAEYPSTDEPNSGFVGSGYPTTDYYDNDDEYDDYRYDGDDFDYYNEDEEEEFPDEDTISLETKRQIEIDRLIASYDPAVLAQGGHQLEDLISNCSWKGIDCKTG